MRKKSPPKTKSLSTPPPSTGDDVHIVKPLYDDTIIIPPELSVLLGDLSDEDFRDTGSGIYELQGEINAITFQELILHQCQVRVWADTRPQVRYVLVKNHGRYQVIYRKHATPKRIWLEYDIEDNPPNLDRNTLRVGNDGIELTRAELKELVIVVTHGLNILEDKV